MKSRRQLAYLGNVAKLRAVSVKVIPKRPTALELCHKCVAVLGVQFIALVGKTGVVSCDCKRKQHIGVAAALCGSFGKEPHPGGGMLVFFARTTEACLKRGGIFTHIVKQTRRVCGVTEAES